MLCLCSMWRGVWLFRSCQSSFFLDDSIVAKRVRLIEMEFELSDQFHRNE